MKSSFQEWIGRTVADLPTPCLTLHRPRLEANLARMQALASGAGKQLRPHVKSHKSSALARRQIAHGAVGICTAKVSEAVALVEAGIRNLLLTGPAITPWARQQIIWCARKDSGFRLVLDDPALATLLGREAVQEGVTLSALLDLDVGQQRTGILPHEADATAAALAAVPGIRLVGIQAYAGHLQHLPSLAWRREANRRALEPALAVWERLAPVYGLTVFSVGGTGTAAFDVTLPGVTEIQPGSYPLMDADYGAVEFEDPRYAAALTLHATVLAARHPGFATLDAGLKAVYRDGPPPQIVVPAGKGLSYDWYGDEYGRLTLPGEQTVSPGDRVEMVVSHCDPTVNLFDRFFVTEDGIVRDIWPIDLRGCSQ